MLTSSKATNSVKGKQKLNVNFRILYCIAKRNVKLTYSCIIKMELLLIDVGYC